MKARILIAVAVLALAGALVFAARPHETTADERVDQITTELRCPRVQVRDLIALYRGSSIIICLTWLRNSCQS